MQNFTFYLPTKLIFGPGEIAQIGAEAKKLGEKAMIVTGKRSSAAHGIINRVTDLLEKDGVGAVVFDKIEPNPRTATIDEAGALARKNGCDLVIGLGGGSPMDAAKAVALVAAENHPIWDYVNHGQPVVKKPLTALPIIEIPTLAATGSEANSGGVITNWETHEKAVFGSPLLFPKVSIIDPELTVTVPEEYTIDGGIDIICHVMEGFFTGIDDTPIQDRFSLAVVRTVMDCLPVAVKEPDNISARSNLSWASAVALSGIIGPGRRGSYPLHAMQHALSAYYDISHGRGLALLLPYLMEYTYPTRPSKYAFMARELFGIDPEGKSELEQAKLGLEWMIDFLRSVGRFMKMKDVGIADDSNFEKMAEVTIRIYSPNKQYLVNPRPLYKEDIIRIFRMAM